MIQLTPHMRIVAAVDPVDFRKGIDGLATVCRQELAIDPFSGTVLVFVNKSRQALRVYCYDGQGFWMCHKRFSKGRFIWNFQSDNARIRALAVRQLQLMLWNADPFIVTTAEDFRPIPNNFGPHEKNSGHGQLSLL